MLLWVDLFDAGATIHAMPFTIAVHTAENAHLVVTADIAVYRFKGFPQSDHGVLYPDAYLTPTTNEVRAALLCRFFVNYPFTPA